MIGLGWRIMVLNETHEVSLHYYSPELANYSSDCSGTTIFSMTSIAITFRILHAGSVDLTGLNAWRIPALPTNHSLKPSWPDLKHREFSLAI